MSEEYTEVTDESCHHYYIPISRFKEWKEWKALDSDSDERAWVVPEWAVSIDGGHLIFKEPRIGWLE